MSPERIVVLRQGAALRLCFPGREQTIHAATLWQSQRDASSVRARLERSPIPPAHLRIMRVEPVGAYGITVAFSDGRNRAIFPWTYLASLPSNVSSQSQPENLNDA